MHGATTREENRQSDIKQSAARRLCNRLREQNLSRNRLIKLEHGAKSPVGKHGNPEYRNDVDELLDHDSAVTTNGGGNYGVYAGDGLIMLDVDEYDGSLPEAIQSLPDTYTVETAHGGQHRYHAVNDDAAQALEDRFGAANPSLTWGEVRARNQYVVGPGSQLDGCSKDWCDECADPHGGQYSVHHDEEIASLNTETLLELVEDERPADETESDTSAESESDEVDATTITSADRSFGGDIDERLESALASDPTLEQLWSGSYAAAGYGGDRSHAEHVLAGRLAFWFDRDKDVVRRLMNRADTRKWTKRTDNSYRDSIIEAVDTQNETYSPSRASPPSPSTLEPPNFDEDVDFSITSEEAFNRCQQMLEDALENGERVLIEALPSVGKSRGIVEAAAETGVPVTILTQRHDLYDQLGDWCSELGLRYQRLPSFTEDCPTYRGDHGGQIQETVRDWYDRGASAQQIHAHAAEELGRDLPCQQGSECPYASKWKLDTDDYDVLIGHYRHAKKTEVVEDRVVVFDEFAEDAFDTVLDENLDRAVTRFLADSDLPLDSVTDLLEERGDDSTVNQIALKKLRDAGIERHGDAVFDDNSTHAAAPRAVYTLLDASGVPADGWERSVLPDGSIGVFDRGDQVVRIREPPKLEDAAGVIALDGTPTKPLWESALGVSLDHRRVLTDAERRAYLSNELELRIIQTTEYEHPYSSGRYVSEQKDRALLREVRQHHGQKPTLVSTQSAIRQYEEHGVLSEVTDHAHYGDLKGTNEFADTRLAVICGTRHFGDAYIRREAAIADEPIDRDGRGMEKTYGEFGDQILRHMREHEALQAIMRFGRDGDGATVYVNTAAIPDWVPLPCVEGVERPHADGMQEVITVLRTTDGPWTSDSIAEQVSISRRQVRTYLKRLCEWGHLNQERDGRQVRYTDVNVDSINPYGLVSLPPTDN